MRRNLGILLLGSSSVRPWHEGADASTLVTWRMQSWGGVGWAGVEMSILVETRIRAATGKHKH